MLTQISVGYHNSDSRTVTLRVAERFKMEKKSDPRKLAWLKLTHDIVNAW